MPDIAAHFRAFRAHLAPTALAANLWRHRSLIRQLARREVEGRYRGSVLGVAWSFINPLILLLVYTFVFGIVFRARWGGTADLGEFAVVLFCGLVVLNAFAECLTRASGLVVAVPNYVKKVLFPLEVLPVAVVVSAGFHAIINVAVLLIVNGARGHLPPPTLALLPLAVIPLVLLSLGLSWFLASLGVFVRDIGYVVVLVLQVLPFITPVFYPLTAVPQPFRTVIRLNPLTGVVEDVRAVALWGHAPDWPRLAVSSAVAAAVTLLGYAWFMKTKRAFADVI